MVKVKITNQGVDLDSVTPAPGFNVERLDKADGKKVELRFRSPTKNVLFKALLINGFIDVSLTPETIPTTTTVTTTVKPHDGDTNTTAADNRNEKPLASTTLANS